MLLSKLTKEMGTFCRLDPHHALRCKIKSKLEKISPLKRSHIPKYPMKHPRQWPRGLWGVNVGKPFTVLKVHQQRDGEWNRERYQRNTNMYTVREKNKIKNEGNK